MSNDHLPPAATPPTDTSAIVVVVPTYNRVALARPVFAALATACQEDGNTTVVVVDQGSSDGVDQVAAEHGFQVVRSTAPTAGALRNVGVAHSTAPWLCFVDSDVLIPPGYLARLRARLAQHPDDLVGCLYSLPEHPVWTERVWDALTVPMVDGPREWLNAGNFALSRALFTRVGGFSETLSSGEDTELCARVLRDGHAVLQYVDLAAAHLGNPKSLRRFVAKQIWHGQGSSFTNRNALAALAHMLLLVAAIGVPLALHWSAAATVATVVLLGNLVPLAAYLQVIRRRGVVASPVPSLALLQAYLLGRFIALWYRSARQR